MTCKKTICHQQLELRAKNVGFWTFSHLSWLHSFCRILLEPGFGLLVHSSQLSGSLEMTCKKTDHQQLKLNLVKIPSKTREKRPTLELNRTKICLDTSFVWVLPSKPRALAAQIKRIQPDSSSGKIMNWKRVRVGKSRDSDEKTDSDSFSIHFFSRWAIGLNPFDLGSLCTRLAWQNPDEAGV